MQCNASATRTLVPAYNVEPVMADVLADLQSLMHHVVVVDYESGDVTADVAVTPSGRIVELKRPIKPGPGAALETGITFGLSRGAEFVATFDAFARRCAG
jgi:polyprenyl-phospho-N-acetylgalactosaminyl synthase